MAHWAAQGIRGHTAVVFSWSAANIPWVSMLLTNVCHDEQYIRLVRQV